MARRKIPSHVQQQVRERADYLCEYCHKNEWYQHVTFQMQHVFPLSLGGEDSLDNLALACFICNNGLSNYLSGFDSTTGEIVPLFNPREQKWQEHFIWSSDGLFLLGLTPTGRATIEIIDINRERTLRIRRDEILLDRHPPKTDPRL